MPSSRFYYPAQVEKCTVTLPICWVKLPVLVIQKVWPGNPSSPETSLWGHLPTEPSLQPCPAIEPCPVAKHSLLSRPCREPNQWVTLVMEQNLWPHPVRAPGEPHSKCRTVLTPTQLQETAGAPSTREFGKKSSPQQGTASSMTLSVASFNYGVQPVAPPGWQHSMNSVQLGAMAEPIL